MTTWCFNCEKWTNHISRDCDQPQMFTNCEHCHNVCLRDSDDSHKSWCQNKGFRSSLAQPFQFVRQTTEALELWCSQELTHVIDGSTLKALSSDPVLVSTENMIMIKNGLTIKLYQLDTNGSVRLSVADSNGNNRLRILADANKFVINNLIRVTQDGTITIRNIEGNAEPSKLHMICMDVERFKIRVVKFGAFGFVVGRNNVVIDNDANNGTFVIFILNFGVK